ncbi:MAG: UpxY family transcription antiterminator [Tidjanibacter sp.]|nr:UpxY family transcription antiterminator [Tidjanibacter sp.]
MKTFEEATDAIGKNEEAISVVGVTTDREAHPKSWKAILVRTCTEKKVCQLLNKKSIEHFLPIQSEVRSWSDRKKTIHRVVIPMIVFVRTDLCEDAELLTLPNVKKFVSYPGSRQPAIIPDTQIDNLKLMTNAPNNPIEISELLPNVECKVRIKSGPLVGLEGNLLTDKSDYPRVAVRVECLGYACVSVSLNDVERVLETV